MRHYGSFLSFVVPVLGGTTVLVLLTGCASCNVKDSDAEVQVVVQRWINHDVADLDKEIERLGGTIETVRRLSTYVQCRNRSIEERRASLDFADLTQTKPPADKLEVTKRREDLVSLMLWFAKDEDSQIRHHAVELLSDELSGDARALNLLVATVENTNEWDETRMWAVMGLGYFPHSELAVETMVKALQIEPIKDDPNERSEQIRYVAVEELQKSELSKVVELVTPLLTDKRLEVREAAQKVIAEIEERKKMNTSAPADVEDSTNEKSDRK